MKEITLKLKESELKLIRRSLRKSAEHYHRIFKCPHNGINTKYAKSIGNTYYDLEEKFYV
jgi:hypothetical protein